MARSGQKQLDLRARARGLTRDPVGLDLGFASLSPSPEVQMQVAELRAKLRADWSSLPVDQTIERLRRYNETLRQTPRPPALAALTDALTDRLLTDPDNEVIDGSARRLLCALKLEPAATRMIVQQPGDKKTLHLRSPRTDGRTCCGMKIGATWRSTNPRGTFMIGEKNREDGISRSVACEECGRKGRALGIDAADELPKFNPFRDDERETLYRELCDTTATLVASLPDEKTLVRQTKLAELIGLAYLDQFGRTVVYRRLCERDQHDNDRVLRELYLKPEPGMLEMIDKAYQGELPQVTAEMWLAAYGSASESYLRGRPPARIWPGSSDRFSGLRLRQSMVAYLIVHAFPKALELASSASGPAAIAVLAAAQTV